MRYLSLFSGIEAATAAWHSLGWTPVAFAELDAFPSAVLAHHYPSTPNLGDITKITEQDIIALGPIDLVVGGFPCQDLSIAGQRKGLKNEDGSATRSGLFFDAMRIVRWAREHCGCRWVLIENVPGLYSSNNGKDLAAVAGEVVGSSFGVPRNGWRTAGIALGPDGLCEWVCLDAQWFGVAQRRRRCFIVGDFGDWQSRPPLFFEQHCLPRDSAPRREKRQTAPTLPSRSTAGGGMGTDFDCDGGLIDVSPTLLAQGNKTGGDRPPGTTVDTCESLIVMSSGQANAEITVDLSPALNCNRDGAPIAFSGQMSTPQVDFDMSSTLGAKNPMAVCFKPSHYTHGKDGAPSEIAPPLSADADKGDQEAIVFQPRYARNGRGAPDTVAGPLTAEAGRTGKGDSAQCVAYAFAQNQRDEVRTMDVAGALAAEPGMKQQTYVACDVADTLSVGANQTTGFRGDIAATNMAVRRLTPVECSRLQQFPDDYLELKYANANEAHAAQILHELWREIGAKGIAAQEANFPQDGSGDVCEKRRIATALFTPEVLLAGVHVGWIQWDQARRSAEHQNITHVGAAGWTDGFVRRLREAGEAGCPPYRRESYQQCASELGYFVQELPLETAQIRAYLQRSELWQEAQGAWTLRYAFATPKEIESGKPLMSDGPRYKALGNSMAVPCMVWLGKRIQEVEDLCT